MILDYSYIVLLGVVMGFIGGFAGIGGSPFMVASLVLIFGYSQIEAQATMTYMILGPITLLGILTQKNRLKKVYRVVIPCIFSYGIASYIGAGFAIKIENSKLLLFFSILLFLLGIIDVQKALKKDEHYLDNYKTHENGVLHSGLGILEPQIYFITIFAFITGLIGGFFGIGAGVLLVSILGNVFGVEKNDARLVSMSLLLLPVGVGAAIQYHEVVPINYPIILILFVSYFFSNYFGAIIGNRQSTKSFKMYYGVLLILTSIIYFAKYQNLL